MLRTQKRKKLDAWQRPPSIYNGQNKDGPASKNQFCAIGFRFSRRPRFQFWGGAKLLFRCFAETSGPMPAPHPGFEGPSPWRFSYTDMVHVVTRWASGAAGFHGNPDAFQASLDATSTDPLSAIIFDRIRDHTEINSCIMEWATRKGAQWTNERGFVCCLKGVPSA